ncbi:MAG: sigma-70 family RNA polymerase sigma factor [Gemmatimonadota bacterium]|nr:MAG: sigma-70 family RNA polymerase sigma factor [Gemmatimonadota bacterium]
MTAPTAALDLSSLAQHHTSQLLARIRRYLPDLDEAKDILQDVWLQVMRKRDAFTGAGSAEGWTLAIARNACLMELRGPHRNARTRSVAVLWQDRWYGTGSHLDPPDARAIRSDLRRDIGRSLAELPVRQRKVVVLRLLEGRSTAETAQALGCTPAAVKSYLHRAVRRMRVSLAHWRPAFKH